MYNIEMRPTFGRIIAVFHICGIWHNGDESNFRKIARKIFYLFNLIIFHILIVASIFLKDNKSESIFYAEAELAVCLVTIKLFYLLWERDAILAFLKDSVTHFVPYHENFVQVNKKINKFINFVHVYLLMFTVTYLLFILTPLPIFSSKKILPFFVNFSLDFKYSEIIYWITYLYMAFGIFFLLLVAVTNLIIWYMMLNYAIKYQILGNRLRNLGVANASKTTVQNESFGQELIVSVKSHHNIIEYNLVTFRKYSNILELCP